MERIHGAGYSHHAMNTNYIKQTPKLAGATLLALGLGITSTFAQTDGTKQVTPRDSDHGHPAYAQPAANYTRGATYGGELTKGDRRFLEKAAKCGAYEVALSRVAADRANHPDVRALAVKMVAAHTAANLELSALAISKGVTLPAKDEIELNKLEKKWNEKKGKDFDEDYLEELASAHEDAIDIFENGADSKDTDIASYAGKLLPVLKEHHTKIEALDKAID